MKDNKSLYELIEEYVGLRDTCYQSDIIKAFSGEYSKQYIKQTCYRLWEDAKIFRLKKVGSTYLVTIWRH